MTWDVLKVEADGSLVLTIPAHTARVLVQEGNEEEQARWLASFAATCHTTTANSLRASAKTKDRSSSV